MNGTTAKILAVIKEFIAQEQYPPTFAEIRDLAGLSTTSLVAYHLERLQANGLVTWREESHGRLG